MKVPTPLVTVNFFRGLGLYSLRARIASSVLSKKVRKYTKQSDYIELRACILRHAPLKYIGWSIAPLQVKQEIQALLSTP